MYVVLTFDLFSPTCCVFTFCIMSTDYLSLYFKEKHNADVPVYTFPRYGYRSLTLGYEAVVQRLGVDTVIAIDGGTDSLMKGNEFEVATVEEDYNTIFAVEAIQNENVTQKFLMNLGIYILSLSLSCSLFSMLNVSEFNHVSD